MMRKARSINVGSVLDSPSHRPVRLLLMVACLTCVLLLSNTFKDLFQGQTCMQSLVAHMTPERFESDTVPPALERVYVAISAHFNPNRLTYLRANLELIGHWQTHVDICIGTNQPDAMQKALDMILATSGIRHSITMCPIRALAEPLMLNWRTKDVLEDAMRSPFGYTAFAFLEDDMFLTWHGLQRWARDTELLKPYNFTRSFMRYEITKDGDALALDYMGTGVRAISVEDKDSVKHYVQAADYGSYCAMFVAERSHMLAYINSSWWQWESGRCCGPGGREMASWAVHHINQPVGWNITAVVPFIDEQEIIDPTGFLFHSPNNYGGIYGIPLWQLNAQARDAVAGLNSSNSSAERHL